MAARVALLGPAVVQVGLCLVLALMLVAARLLAARRGGAWPARASRISASYSNQFEMPVLFFALIGITLATGRADSELVTLAWAFVVARLAQAAVHVTINLVPLRGACFAIGLAAVMLGWAHLGWIVMAS